MKNNVIVEGVRVDLDGFREYTGWRPTPPERTRTEQEEPAGIVILALIYFFCGLMGLVYLLFLSPIAQRVWGVFLIAGLIFVMVWNLIYNTTFYDGPIIWK